MIRLAGTGDVDAVAHVERECFAGAAWSPGLVRAEIEGHRRTVLVDEQADSIVAYGSISVIDGVADLHRIAVLAGARRQGVARALLAELTRSARHEGASRMLLEVADDNQSAMTLYTSLGFVIISRRRRYYPDGADSLVMEAAMEPDRTEADGGA